MMRRRFASPRVRILPLREGERALLPHPCPWRLGNLAGGGAAIGRRNPNLKEISMGRTLNPSADATDQGAGIVGEGVAQGKGPGPEVMAASTLEGDKILCIEDEEVGKVKEIMLDVERGTIAYVVMKSGGFLGIGDKLMAIPWNALALDTDRKCLLLAMPADRVKNAPGFDKDHWPSMADTTWATSLHQYYGIEPYWDIDALGDDELGASDLDPEPPGRRGAKR
jgi:sporulation protein YlmC with PRC-barrel domain